MVKIVKYGVLWYSNWSSESVLGLIKANSAVQQNECIGGLN